MIRKHYKEKPFPCDRCELKFYTITDVQKHIKIKHLNEKPLLVKNVANNILRPEDS